METDLLLNALLDEVKRTPLPGIAPAYLDAFVQRHRDTLRQLLETHLAPFISGSRPDPTDDQVAPTPWGGLKGGLLSPAAIREGIRAVTSSGEHGVVQRILRWQWEDGRLEQEQALSSRAFVILLDSGRSETAAELFLERRPPSAVVPDLEVVPGSGFLQSPEEVWQEIARDFAQVEWHRRKAREARSPLSRAQFLEKAEQAVTRLRPTLRSFRTWLERHPEATVRGLDLRKYRLGVLEAQLDSPQWPGEADWLWEVPEDWPSRYSPGDGVLWPRLEAGGAVQTQDRLLSHDGREAELASGARAPLYTLMPAPEATGERDEFRFEVPIHGQVRVEPGAGRGQQWTYIHLGPVRFAFDGLRWARGAKPPAEVMHELKRRRLLPGAS